MEFLPITFFLLYTMHKQVVYLYVSCFIRIRYFIRTAFLLTKYEVLIVSLLCHYYFINRLIVFSLKYY